MKTDPWRMHLHPDVTLAMPHSTAGRGDDGDPPAQEILDTMRVPILVLDRELRVVTANRAFRLTFGLTRHDVLGQPVHALGDGQWNLPELRALLETIVPQHTVMDAYEVEQEFSGLGRRSMLLNARALSGEGEAPTRILLAIEDVTEQRAAERAVRDLVQERDALLHELPRRVATSLQVIASVLRARARMAGSDETRRHLADAHNRVMSLTALQRQVRASDSGATVELGPYLSRLCEILAPSESVDRHPVALQVQVGRGAVSSARAVSIGLAVTELVVNALEHAFPDEQDDGTVIVAYEQAGPDWTLSISDNGIGRPAEQWDQAYPGLGTIVVEALVKRLDACLEVEMDTNGTTVSVVHGARFATPCAATPKRHAAFGSVGPGQAARGDAVPKNGA